MALRNCFGSMVFLALFAGLGATPLKAQSVLCVESQGKAYVVRKVHSGRPYVEKGGKLVAMTTQRCGLMPVPEFMPAFITVRDLQVSTAHATMIGSTAEMNHEFLFKANFSSTYSLSDVFLVLELNTERNGKMVFFYEVGQLGPGKSRPMNLRVPMSSGLGPGKYEMHLFTDGVEVFHSNHPMPFRERMLDKMIAKRIAGVPDSGPKPFFGPTPEYPKELRKAGTKGTALLSIRITRTGAVLDPVVKEASNPAFGEAALVAVRLWRFLPKVENGRATEMTADLPFSFSPPDDASKS